MFKRVVLKLSGEVLAGDFDDNKQIGNEAKDLGHFHIPTVNRIVSEICEVNQKGTQISLVIGGGNFCRGKDSKGCIERTKVDNMGMLASVMNCMYIADSLRLKNVEAHVLTPFSIGGMTEIYSTELALKYLNQNHVVIFGGGTGLPFFSTDTIAAVRAGELTEILPNGDKIETVVLYAKNEEGVFDRDPRKDKINAKLLREVSYTHMIKENLGVVDIAALHICNEHRIKAQVFDLRVEKSIVIACESDERIKEIGTNIIFGH